jgi:hypothetical protein
VKNPLFAGFAFGCTVDGTEIILATGAVLEFHCFHILELA